MLTPGKVRQCLAQKFPYTDVLRSKFNLRIVYGRVQQNGRAYVWVEVERSKKRVAGTCSNPIYDWRIIQVQYDRSHFECDEIAGLFEQAG